MAATLVTTIASAQNLVMPDNCNLFGPTVSTSTWRSIVGPFAFHAGRNTATHPNADLHVMTDASAGLGNAVCYVTWYKVGLSA